MRGILLLLVLPYFLSPYYLGLVVKMMIFALFAMSLDLLIGYTGMASLGHAAYFGIAAYATGLLALRLGWSVWLALPVGLIVAALTATLFGLLALRTRGSYFLMITLALSQVLWGIASGWRTLTGGDDGLPDVPRPDLGLPWSLADSTPFYYFVLFFVMAGTLLLVRIVTSPFGYALRGIRESETRMLALGYNVWRYKLVAFIIAAMFGGLAGCLYVYFNRFVSPDYIHVVRSAEGFADGHPGRRRNADWTGHRRRANRAAGKYHQHLHRTLADFARLRLRPGRAVCPERSRRIDSKLSQAKSRTVSALIVERLSRNFGGVQALSDVSFTVEPGERRLIIGPNGAGKTTLFNMLSGAFAVSSGRVTLLGRDITQLPAYERARMGLARTFQITNLFPQLTVLENVLLALQAADDTAFSLHRRMRANHRLINNANALLEQWGLAPIAEQATKEISYGEQRQVDLILAMAVQPKVLLLDEPTAGLSAAEVVRVVGMVRSLPRAMTILMIEHDMDVAFELADRITVLHQGRLLAEGGVEAIRNDPKVTEIYLGVDEQPC